MRAGRARAARRDAERLRRGWGERAAAEARHRIDAAVAELALDAVRHWTRVWETLMRAEPGLVR